MKEEVEVHHYNRLTPLQTEPDVLSGYEDVQAGDCIVAFSRSEIHNIKQAQSTP